MITLIRQARAHFVVSFSNKPRQALSRIDNAANFPSKDIDAILTRNREFKLNRRKFAAAIVNGLVH